MAMGSAGDGRRYRGDSVTCEAKPRVSRAEQGCFAILSTISGG